MSSMAVGNKSIFSSTKFPTNLAMMSTRVHMFSLDVIEKVGGLGD